MNKYFIIAKNDSSPIINDLKTKLNQSGFIYNESNFDYLFIIGGDGTFLRYIKDYLFKSIKIIFINGGTLGFLSAFSKIDEFNINDLFDDNHFINLDLIQTNYLNYELYSINEVVIRSNYSLKLDLIINDCLLENITANGFCLSTFLGSTGWNKSLNGTLILPNNNVWTIKEIEPIINKNNCAIISPLVVNNQDIIKINLNAKNKWCILSDGQQFEFNNLENQMVESKIVKSTCQILLKLDYQSWFKRIKHCLL